MNKYEPSSSFWKGRKVLVTGGSGFIGSHLVDILLDVDSIIRVPSRNSDNCWRFLSHARKDIELVIGDLRDHNTTYDLLGDVDIVMHLAATVGGIEYNIKHPGSIFRENMQAFMNVLEAARLRKTEKVLITSSACVYPRHCSIPTPESEGFKDRPEPTNEGYGWAKRMEEFLSEAYAKEYGMYIRVARPYNAYGPRDNFDPESSHVIPALIHRVESGENPLVVWGDGTATRGFLHAKDFAKGLMAVIELSPRVEAINIGPSEETTIRELATIVVEESGRNLEIEFDSTKPTGQPRRCCDTSLAEKLLGFRAQIPIRNGIKETINWYRANIGPQ
jgi:GDP-L-fucose synthase